MGLKQYVCRTGEDDEVMETLLCDLQWAGKAGEAGYPLWRNHGELGWPVGAESGELILEEFNVEVFDTSWDQMETLKVSHAFLVVLSICPNSSPTFLSDNILNALDDQSEQESRTCVWLWCRYTCCNRVQTVKVRSRRNGLILYLVYQLYLLHLLHKFLGLLVINEVLTISNLAWVTKMWSSTSSIWVILASQVFKYERGTTKLFSACRACLQTEGRGNKRLPLMRLCMSSKIHAIKIQNLKTV